MIERRAQARRARVARGAAAGCDRGLGAEGAGGGVILCLPRGDVDLT